MYTAPYNANATTASIAASLATAVSSDASALVTATASGDTVNLASRATGDQVSFSLSASWAWDTTDFTAPSFTATTSGTVAGGTDGPPVFGGHAYTTLYTYDALGNLLKVTQQGGSSDPSQWRVRTFSYDSLDRLLTANNPESGAITYQYDADGSMVSKTDARGVTVSYSYDEQNRVTQKTFSNGDVPEVYTYDRSSDPTWQAGDAVGHLVRASKSGGHWFKYDSLGRVILTWQCLPSDCTNGASVAAAYDLGGDLTQLTYPSGRVVTFGYNSAEYLNNVTFAKAADGSNVGYTYWSVNDANFHPTGAPKLVSLGNGVKETTILNPRLQLLQETVTNSSIGTFADHVYGYGAPSANNGNVMSVADQLNPGRTQTFTYDALNRLATANESRWGMSYVYDPWGNYLQQNLTAGAGYQHQYTVATNNRLNGYSYDAAGNMLNDGFHAYAYDAQSEITQADGGSASGGATYTYDAEGNRLRKDTGSGATEYVYFSSEIIAEKNVTTGLWTDYIFANGKRIAKADTVDLGLHLHGVNCSNCGAQYSDFYFPYSQGYYGYVIQPGDKLLFEQYQPTGVRGGMYISFTDGTALLGQASDSDGQPVAADGVQNLTHFRKVDLSGFAGKTINIVTFHVDPATAAGPWDLSFDSVALTSLDGTVRPLWTHESSVTLWPGATSGVSGLTYEVRPSLGTTPVLTTTYYHGDQIGSSRLLTDGWGMPIWQATFLPYGEEYNPQITTNHYKFTGKERDSETGLDYFGARYYSNGLGRFITPDWAAKPVTVPYAVLGDPQTLNLYSYVRDIPSSRIDPDGHENLKPQDWDVHNDPTPTEFDRQMSSVLLDGFATVTGPLGRAYFAAQAIHDLRSGNTTAGVVGLAAVLPLGKVAGSVWGMGNFARGVAVETALGKNLANGFPVIDKFVNGTATSIKSIDLTSKSYQNTEKLASTLEKYVGKVADFKGAKYGKDVVEGSAIKARELQVAIPQGSMSAAQRDVFNAAAKSAEKQGVKLTVTEMR